MERLTLCTPVSLPSLSLPWLTPIRSTLWSLSLHSHSNLSTIQPESLAKTLPSNSLFPWLVSRNRTKSLSESNYWRIDWKQVGSERVQTTIYAEKIFNISFLWVLTTLSSLALHSYILLHLTVMLGLTNSLVSLTTFLNLPQFSHNLCHLILHPLPFNYCPTQLYISLTSRRGRGDPNPVREAQAWISLQWSSTDYLFLSQFKRERQLRKWERVGKELESVDKVWVIRGEGWER